MFPSQIPMSTLRGIFLLTDPKHRIADFFEIVEALPGPLAIVDLQGHIVRSNQAFDEFVGVSSGKSGALLESLFGLDSGSFTFLLSNADSDNQGIGLQGQFSGYRLQCKEIPSIGGVRVLSFEESSANGFGNNSEVKDFNVYRMAKLAAIGELAAIIAHDLRGPLSVITSNVGIMTRRYQQDEKLMKRLSKIDFACDRIGKMIGQMTHFMREEEEFGEVDVEEVLHNVSLLIEGKIRRLEVEFSYDSAEASGQLWGNQIQLEQVFMNLISNACDAVSSMPRGQRTVKIDAQDSENQILITVIDSGFGLDQSLKHRIFDSGYTTKEDGKGTGLGLRAVQGIVAAHGGTIEVESDMGKGTKFLIYLPVNQQKTLAG